VSKSLRAKKRVVAKPAGGNEAQWILSKAPTITTSGQIAWTIRDLLFSPGRREAADAFRPAKDEAEKKVG